MSDSSRARVVYRPETVFGEAAPANAATTLLRLSSCSFSQKNTTVVSDEIRGDRQRDDVILVGLDSQGDITHEAVYGGFFETELQAALGGTWASDVLRNGLTKRSFGIEQGFIDIGQYMYFPGCVIDKLVIDITAKKPVTITSSWMGQPAVGGSASVAGTTTPTAAVANSVMRAGPDISLASSGGSNIELNGVTAQKLTLSISNNLRRHDLATSFTTDNFGYGAMEIEFTLDTYFKDLTAWNGFIASQLFSLRFNMRDPLLGTNNAYQITLPKCKLTDAPVAIPGVDQDIMQTLSGRALIDTGVGYTINVERNVDL